MSDQEGPGFIIRDRRGRGEQGEEPRQEKPSARSASAAPTGGTTAEASGAAEAGVPPISFSSFVFSLGTSALMLMGEQVDPQQPPIQANLPQAKEIVDILSLLEEKTRGNLSNDEQAVLRDMLYALRMKYVALASGKQAPQAS